jgi:hypothetical protein
MLVIDIDNTDDYLLIAKNNGITFVDTQNSMQDVLFVPITNIAFPLMYTHRTRNKNWREGATFKIMEATYERF